MLSGSHHAFHGKVRVSGEIEEHGVITKHDMLRQRTLYIILASVIEMHHNFDRAFLRLSSSAPLLYQARR